MPQINAATQCQATVPIFADFFIINVILLFLDIMPQGEISAIADIIPGSGRIPPRVGASELSLPCRGFIHAKAEDLDFPLSYYNVVSLQSLVNRRGHETWCKKHCSPVCFSFRGCS